MVSEEHLNIIKKLIPNANLKRVKPFGVNGMTNTSYLCEGNIIRIPIPEYAPTINRECERIAIKLLSSCDGMSLPYVMDEEGNSARKLINGLQYNDLSTNPLFEKDIIQSLIGVMDSIHDVDIEEYKNNQVLDIKKRVLHAINLNGNAYPIHEDTCLKCLEELEAYQLPKVLCHGDMMPSNVIVDGTNVTLIDFEYACIADYMYDIACFGNMGDEYGIKLLHAKCGNMSMFNECEHQYYLWRFIQTYMWLNIAEYKAKVANSKVISNFFLTYADGCKSSITSKYYPKLICH